MKTTKIIAVVCLQCGQEYIPEHIPDVCGCGNCFGAWGGGFENVYEEDEKEYKEEE